MPYQTKGIRIDTRELDRLRAELKPRAQKILYDTAAAVEAEAKMHAPRDPARPPKDLSVPVTGHLRGSIQKKRVAEWTWWVEVMADYGIYQELGTSRIPARPYLGPAVETLRAKFEKVWKELFT